MLSTEQVPTCSTYLLAGQRVVDLENGFLDKRFWNLPFRLGDFGSSSLSHDARVRAGNRMIGRLVCRPELEGYAKRKNRYRGKGGNECGRSRQSLDALK
jgi:hypothetical protein